jgi:hypothetical protein
MTLKYEAGEPPEWEAGVGALQLRRVGNSRPPSFEIVGPCPRCKDELTEDVSYVVAPAVGLPTRQEPIRIRIVCNCAAYHEGAPAGVEGCGASGGVEITV